MEIYTYYNLDCISEEELNTVKNYFEAREMSVTVNDLHIFIESDESKKEPYEIESETTHIEVAIKDWTAIASTLGRDFTVSGTVDTSYTAGEYMDFRLEYRDKTFSAFYSDWYLECDLDGYEDYEEFCEEEGELCTSEEFEKLQDKEVYIIEQENDNVLSEEVPLIYKL